ncbi:IQ domain-containing protein IQM1-like [Canna indica]|uniref:IQ domain-containing protein IQM1-like n=1 Tax=Canna indica TaxID=4628 RepID=A0AAQ3QDX3_9LILI|nr:IQ domain-containing protein IQM1-like [Canna indica]
MHTSRRGQTTSEAEDWSPQTEENSSAFISSKSLLKSMALSLSFPTWACFAVIRSMISALLGEYIHVSLKSFSCLEKICNTNLGLARLHKTHSGIKVASNASLIASLSFKDWEATQYECENVASSKEKELSTESTENVERPDLDTPKSFLSSSLSMNELVAAAIKVQKVYKSYQTRRNLADCAVVIEELWWKASDYASLKHSSISFFNDGKPETVASRWARARTRAAKVGKGLSKDHKAQKLALQHWLEAIDPRHRYGHNLHLYYDVWFRSESTQPFFYWLDVGDGKEVTLENCPRIKLQHQCIKYLGPKERQAYEVIVDDSKLVYKQSGTHVNSTEGSKWIFVLSTSRKLYVGQKIKGSFQHSSFLAGGATTAAGRLVAKEGILQSLWPYSGHYLPTEENFNEFINFLQDNNVNLTNVKRYSILQDDECSSLALPCNELVSTSKVTKIAELQETGSSSETEAEEVPSVSHKSELHESDNMETTFEFSNYLNRKWTTGVGPRISCVRDYPTDLQFKALEQVNLSPRTSPSSAGPVPSPRPYTTMILSPRLAHMGFPTPTISLTLPEIQHKNH